MHIPELYRSFQKHRKVSTDSRTVTPGTLFFALRGESFDGNRFVMDALHQGAAIAVADDPEIGPDHRILLVDDVLKTLQDLASFHRSKMKAKFLAITGSNGKTTTKELVSRVLSTTYRTHSTRGNLNNHIGLPLTLLEMKDDMEMAVIEMGANHPGEIARLCEIAMPEYGLVTNFGKAHLEGFGGMEGVVKAKSELFAYLRKHDGLAFYNADDQQISRRVAGLRSSSYGSGTKADCRGRITGLDPSLSLQWKANDHWTDLQTKLYGGYNFANIMAAICVGKYFKVRPGEIGRAISHYVPDNNRSQLVRAGTNTLILDAYNANPSSMRAALDNFILVDAPHKTVILGDMLELGKDSEKEHADMLEFIKSLGLEKIILVGPVFSSLTRNKGITAFGTVEEALDFLRESPLGNQLILIKGSRKIRLEELVHAFHRS